LLSAAENGHYELVDLFLDRGATKTTGLLHALVYHMGGLRTSVERNGEYEAKVAMIESVIARFPNMVNSRLKSGTPLIRAVDLRDSPMVRLLLDRGADARIKDDHGRTAMSLVENSRDSCSYRIKMMLRGSLGLPVYAPWGRTN
jgi:ankyrin repeat protein